MSRSFYLTLRVLPSRLRPSISLAYLLARASDTIADTRVVPRDKRYAHLISFRRQFERSVNPAELAQIKADLATQQSASAEKLLLEQMDACFAMLASLPQYDQKRIVELLGVISRGQESDLLFFPGDDINHLAAYASEQQLDDYTYAVAGCVGRFWTEMCCAYLPRLSNWNVVQMTQLGIRFGKGLQMINILRDIPGDLQIGRCYIPKDRLAEIGLQPLDLMNPAAMQRFRPLYNYYLDLTLKHLEVGWRYMLSIPASLSRARLACIWPIVIGLKTMARLRHSENVLDPSKKVQITRGEVYRILIKSFLICGNDGMLNSWYNKLAAEASAKNP